jgi:hypothetical protein
MDSEPGQKAGSTRRVWDVDPDRRERKAIDTTIANTIGTLKYCFVRKSLKIRSDSPNNRDTGGA